MTLLPLCLRLVKQRLDGKELDWEEYKDGDGAGNYDGNRDTVRKTIANIFKHTFILI